MRSISRVSLRQQAHHWLQAQQAALNDDPNGSAERLWQTRRRLMNTNGIVDALARMSGRLSRCMYCGDSEGCDVEHYRPKSDPRFRVHVFHWDNLLWVCAPCNRLKGARFTLDSDTGQALLLNPCCDSPWDFLEFVIETGLLVPRYGIGGLEERRASETLDPTFTRLQHDVIARSRTDSAFRMIRAARGFLNSVRGSSERDDLMCGILEAGHPELIEWFLAREGSALAPFSILVHEVQLVTQIRSEANRQFPGLWP